MPAASKACQQLIKLVSRNNATQWFFWFFFFCYRYAHFLCCLFQGRKNDISLFLTALLIIVASRCFKACAASQLHRPNWRPPCVSIRQHTSAYVSIRQHLLQANFIGLIHGLLAHHEMREREARHFRRCFQRSFHGFRCWENSRHCRGVSPPPKKRVSRCFHYELLVVMRCESCQSRGFTSKKKLVKKNKKSQPVLSDFQFCSHYELLTLGGVSRVNAGEVSVKALLRLYSGSVRLY